MSLKNTKTSYGLVSKSIHWLMALIVISMLAVGFFMGDFSKPLKSTVYMLHKSFGLLILTLVVVRLIWNWTTSTPDYEESLTPIEQKTSTAGHHLLYLLLLVMPLTGLFMSIASKRYPTFFNLFTVSYFPAIPETKYFSQLMHDSHEIIAWVFVMVISLHILAALKHHFISKNNVLKRMMFSCCGKS